MIQQTFDHSCVPLTPSLALSLDLDVSADLPVGARSAYDPTSAHLNRLGEDEGDSLDDVHEERSPFISLRFLHAQPGIEARLDTMVHGERVSVLQRERERERFRALIEQEPPGAPSSARDRSGPSP